MWLVILKDQTERLEVVLTVEATEGQVPEGDGACPARQRAGWEREPAAAYEEQGWQLRPGARGPGSSTCRGC